MVQSSVNYNLVVGRIVMGPNAAVYLLAPGKMLDTDPPGEVTLIQFTEDLSEIVDSSLRG